MILLHNIYFAIPKSTRLNSTHDFIMNISNKREIQQIVSSHSADTDFKGYTNLYKKSTAKLYSYIVLDTTPASDDDASENTKN